MRDPEITFTVDRDTNSVQPTSYLQDDMGIFYTTDNCPAAKVRDLEQFFSQWLTNIKSQGFRPDGQQDESENER